MVLSYFIRGALISLHKEGLSAANIKERIERDFGVIVSVQTVQRRRAEYKRRGLRPKRKTRGRKPKCEKAHRIRIKRLALQNRWVSLRALTELVNIDFRDEGIRVGKDSTKSAS